MLVNKIQPYCFVYYETVVIKPSMDHFGRYFSTQILHTHVCPVFRAEMPKNEQI